jgi:enoyl-CoA hydratase
MSEFTTVDLRVHAPTATLTIDRAEKLNALNAKTLEELNAALDEVEKDDAVRALVATGAGEKAFVAGADIAELRDNDVTTARAFAERGQKTFARLERFPKPIIAAVNGYALGGGCELASACHIRYASETARFGQPEINLGVIPGYGGTRRLARLVGKGRALEMILSGETIDAEEALRIGLVNRVVPLAELAEEAEKAARLFASKPKHALEFAIASVNAAEDADLDEAYKKEASFFAMCFGYPDCEEGIAAFLEKRSPNFE